MSIIDSERASLGYILYSTYLLITKSNTMAGWSSDLMRTLYGSCVEEWPTWSQWSCMNSLHNAVWTQSMRNRFALGNLVTDSEPVSVDGPLDFLQLNIWTCLYHGNLFFQRHKLCCISDIALSGMWFPVQHFAQEVSCVHYSNIHILHWKSCVPKANCLWRDKTRSLTTWTIFPYKIVITGKRYDKSSEDNPTKGFSGIQLAQLSRDNSGFVCSVIGLFGTSEQNPLVTRGSCLINSTTWVDHSYITYTSKIMLSRC